MLGQRLRWPRLAATASLAAAIAVGACEGESVKVPADSVINLSGEFSSDFALVDQHGRQVRNTDFRDRIMVVYFGFATCPDVCPLALSRLSAALDELSPSERASLAPIFITVDPERDTPEALARFLAFDDRIIGLTGPVEAVDAARASYRVYARRQPMPDSALKYTVDHSSFFYVVDKKGRVDFALKDSLTPAELAAALRRSIPAR